MTKVLVVEDDPLIGELVQQGLEAEGYTVDLSADSESALELSRGNDYALVILDRMLPGADGIELCQTLRGEGPDRFILMLTAKDALQDRLDGLDAGADDYLIKPFAFDELRARLRALLRRAP